MAVHIRQYPSPESEAFVIGDPAAFMMRVKVEGVDQDITGWTWRSHVRGAFHNTDPISVATNFVVNSPDELPGIFDDSSSVPSVLTVHWTADQTKLWRNGFVADIEELSPIKHTWVIMDFLRVDKDATHTVALQ